MADAVSAEEWVKRARRLDDAARHHKREEGRHRRAAQQARQQLADLTRECERLGITISIQKPGEGLSPWPQKRKTPQSSI